VDEGEVVSCPECGSDFEVITANPIELNRWTKKTTKTKTRRRSKRARTTETSPERKPQSRLLSKYAPAVGRGRLGSGHRFVCQRACGAPTGEGKALRTDLRHRVGS